MNMNLYRINLNKYIHHLKILFYRFTNDTNPQYKKINILYRINNAIYSLFSQNIRNICNLIHKMLIK